MNRYLTFSALLFASLTSCVTSESDRAFPDEAITHAKHPFEHPTDIDIVEHRLPIESLKQLEQQKLLPDNGASTIRFGTAVAVDGTTAVVSARGVVNHGAAYVFVRDGATWAQQAELLIDDGNPGDNYGYSVAVSGDTVLVGAFLGTISGNTTGSVYVFTRKGGVWTQQAKLSADDGKGLDLFGISVALAGDTAIVGAFQAGKGKPGEAYVFVRNGDTWSEQAKLRAEDGAHADDFGISVALSGDTALIGADAVGAQGEASGAAYFFVRDGQTWKQQAKVVASDHAAYNFFGNPVAIAGNTAIVGSYLASGGASNSGEAYLFVRDGAKWTEQKKLTASDGAAGDGFGISVAIAGDTVAVGALDGSGKSAHSGTAYVFQKSCSGAWVQKQKLAASDGATSDEFGYQVALSGSSLLVGAAAHDDQGKDSGAAYYFSLTGMLKNGQPCVEDSACAGGACLDGVCGCTVASGAGSGGTGGQDAGVDPISTVGSTGGAGGTGGATSDLAATTGGGTTSSEEWCPIGAPPPGSLCVLAAGGGGCAFQAGGSAGAPGAGPLGGLFTMLALSLLARRKAAS